MNLAKKITAVLLVIIMIFCFAACGASDEAEAALDIGTINIGFIATGDIEEDPFSAMHYNLFKSAYGLSGAGDGQVTIEENVPAGDTAAMETAIADLVARGCRLVVGIDPSYHDEFVKYAKDNSNIFFAVPGTYEKGSEVSENLAVLNVNYFETEYLQGIAAGLAASAVGRNPGAESEVTSTMILGQAVAETTGLYGLLVAILLMFVHPLG